MYNTNFHTNPHSVAWEIIDIQVDENYDGNKGALIEEVGNLDNYAYRIAEAIKLNDIPTWDTKQCAIEVELYL